MPLDFQAIRDRNTQAINAAGFRFPKWLPLGDSATVRPCDEIVRRLAALQALFAYDCATPQRCPATRINAMLDDHALPPWLTTSETEILTLKRPAAREQHIHTIGWRLENMLPLQWVLGHDLVPRVDGHMVNDEEIQQIIHGFGPTSSQECARMLRARKMRPLNHIIEMEDLFYCAHNAARNAAYNSSDSVPPDFHPFINGGVIQERRHALTWVLSAGTAWDDTDLST